MSRVILVNPNYYTDIFAASKAKAAIARETPPLGLACLGATLLRDGHQVRLLDLNSADLPDAHLEKAVQEFQPDLVGITSTTPIIKTVYRLAAMVKGQSPTTLVVAGGPHPTALPQEVLAESQLDAVVAGEGDLAMAQLASQGPSPDIPNLWTKSGDEIIPPARPHFFLNDLDSLPYPAYELIDVRRYRQPLISSRKSPVGYMETSRGCFGRCIFCNKNIHGYRVRMKSPQRVVDEMERLLSLGFEEVHIIDDIFTFRRDRAMEICQEILRRGLKFPWYPRGGLRVDKAGLDMFRMMKRAGCYRVPFGIESGSQRVLDRLGKYITIEQARRAVAMAKKAGLETECYFMLGHPGETVEDIEASIKLALELAPHYCKFAITIPLPGTALFDSMEANGQIKSRDWEKYTFATSPRQLYDHDTLSWEEIERYYDASHRRFYLRPSYMARMVGHSLANGTFWGHVKAFLGTRW